MVAIELGELRPSQIEFGGGVTQTLNFANKKKKARCCRYEAPSGFASFVGVLAARKVFLVDNNIQQAVVTTVSPDPARAFVFDMLRHRPAFCTWEDCELPCITHYS